MKEMDIKAPEGVGRKKPQWRGSMEAYIGLRIPEAKSRPDEAQCSPAKGPGKSVDMDGSCEAWDSILGEVWSHVLLWHQGN